MGDEKRLYKYRSHKKILKVQKILPMVLLAGVLSMTGMMRPANVYAAPQDEEQDQSDLNDESDPEELQNRLDALIEEVDQVDTEREQLLEGLDEQEQRIIVGSAARAAGEQAISERQEEADKLDEQLKSAGEAREKAHDSMLDRHSSVAGMQEYKRAVSAYMQLKLQKYHLNSQLKVLRKEQAVVENSLSREQDGRTLDQSMQDKADQYLELTRQENDKIAGIQALKQRIDALEAENSSGESDDTDASESQDTEASAESSNTGSSEGSSILGTSLPDAASENDTGIGEADSAYENTGDAAGQNGNNVSSAEPSGTGITGEDVVQYALQFVGNPYVWGGTSLTNGCDCSGFVQQVYAHFGIQLTRTTYTQANEGTAVSYADMQPGDVINYGSHTAIYIGDNRIVHAANSQEGIIVSDNPAFMPVVTVRRFV